MSFIIFLHKNKYIVFCVSTTMLNVIQKIQKTISPVLEISSYEALWTHNPGVARISTIFQKYNHALPSTVASSEGILVEEIEKIKKKLENFLSFTDYSALFYNDFEYPSRLKDAQHPAEILYFQGNLDILSSPSIAIVGARKASNEGIRRAKKLAHILIENDITVISGLAEGIDTAAHTAAIEAGGQTIAVIGTPLNKSYPASNKDLQAKIAKNFLLVSQVPFYWTSNQHYKATRFFFPERNKTMSALSKATVIVEASETSGSLTQARAALSQGRKLFILNSCFQTGLKWPHEFLKKGAIKVVDGSEILEEIQKQDC
ncbi:DNA-processing protein DprA [Baaleninema simplex]|uniref:DNA-processing protein DprA n=1 Tax=Baaleninema simplex TaxID=2862350 RepID=UPI00192BD6A0|nr:DNA-processing protein DprA [Baaleninema simplex]